MIYKYFHPDRIDVLENLKIRFTQPNALNDPFECKPLISAKNVSNSLLQRAEIKFTQMFDEFISQEGIKESEKFEAEQIVRNEQLKMKARFEKSYSEITKNFFELMNETIGVLSLTKDQKNLLMWAHYGDEHRGFVLGFDENNIFFHLPSFIEEYTEIHEIVYTREKKAIEINDIHQTDIYSRMLCTKSVEWEYEKELRVFRLFDDEVIEIGTDFGGYPIFLFDFPKQMIIEVIIGARADESLVKSIINILDQHSMNWVKILRAHVSDRHYCLDFTPHIFHT